MPTDRRDFLRLTAAATGGLGLGVSPESLVAGSFRTPEPPARRAIRILILGGTGFIGPHQVRYALDRGHTVTLFNRGRSTPGKRCVFVRPRLKSVTVCPRSNA